MVNSNEYRELQVNFVNPPIHTGAPDNVTAFQFMIYQEQCPQSLVRKGNRKRRRLLKLVAENSVFSIKKHRFFGIFAQYVN
jgi:hypothetical protein